MQTLIKYCKYENLLINTPELDNMATPVRPMVNKSYIISSRIVVKKMLAPKTPTRSTIACVVSNELSQARWIRKIVNTYIEKLHIGVMFFLTNDERYVAHSSRTKYPLMIIRS